MNKLSNVNVQANNEMITSSGIEDAALVSIKSFAEGGVVNSDRDLFQKDGGTIYKYIGTVPYLVQPDSTPVGDKDWMPYSISTIAFSAVEDMRNYNGNLIEGTVVVLRNWHRDLEGGGGLFKVVTGNFKDDGGVTLISNSGVIFLRIGVANPLPAEYFGVVPKFKGDIHAMLTNAIDYGGDVKIPRGYFKSSGTFCRHKGQRISGTGVFEKSFLTETKKTWGIITTIEFTEDVDGFDTTQNIALGGGYDHLALIAPPNSTKVGVKDGLLHKSGNSQSIGAYNEFLYIKGFSTGYQLAGWCWEVNNFRVHTELSREWGIHIAGSANVVHLNSCSAVTGANIAGGTEKNKRTGLRIDAGKCVVITNFHNENNRKGMQFNGGYVTINGYYSEGARDMDIEVTYALDEHGKPVPNEGSLTINDGVFLHQLQGRSVAIMAVRKDYTDKAFIDIKRPLIKANNGNVLDCLLDIGNINATVRMTDIKNEGTFVRTYNRWHGKGAPNEMSFVDLPRYRIMRAYGRSPELAVVVGETSSSVAPPVDLGLQMEDGTKIAIVTEGSRVWNYHPASGIAGWDFTNAGVWVPFKFNY
ncbi:hypothetical protein Xmau_03119 [Xenorhabdus mauleonii]|uniref:Uncharacterized protein n=1 Tax=Xenorhabdus mauleonii TaxID=351675 RepID=A0A1I3SJN2_9GAMM|nr:hypothetical protein [Xenorhabdus mauleonii]PHM39212.1 hypothetical protein Xmau_03119 [Xenorhabdus mauleonii]SFJ58954.1 hypothetical protein SAMN05421680_111140 [Xenorhabdus mauleonii]